MSARNPTIVAAASMASSPGRGDGVLPSGGAACEEKLLRVGELARRTGKTARAIRFYEELGLVMPAKRTKGGFRQYSQDALVRIHWIDRLQELGFALAEIGDFLSALKEKDQGPAAMDALRVFYGRKLIETRSAIRRMQALEAEIIESLSYLSVCEHCAPETPRSACRTCSVEAHREHPQPALIAAVHFPG
ncbi:MAG: hypothetical protein CL927_10105 [Deltaproteobacteria bacterium]|nr:hypothetical protein [Deltaproteobacteria bacterium]HCH66819.1 hypothetical protein [Deltaproteobacteria bacterium]